MALCTPITADIAFDCTAPSESGVKARVIVINYEDWKAATITVDAGTNEIDLITLAAGGTEAFEIQVPEPKHIIATDPLVIVGGVNGYRPQVQLSVNSISQANYEQIASTRFGKVVVIVELIEGRSILYGGWADATPEPSGVGMRLIEYPGNNLGDPDLGGVMQFTWGSSDTEPVNYMPAHLIASSFDIDTLLTPTA